MMDKNITIFMSKRDNQRQISAPLKNSCFVGYFDGFLYIKCKRQKVKNMLKWIV